MRQATWIAVLLAVLLPLTLLAADNPPLMHTQILSATAARTVVAASFDAEALAAKLAARQPGSSLSDGTGLLLAIAGHGTPEARVTRFDLGDVVHLTSSLDDAEIPHSVSELAFVSDPFVMHDLRIVTLGYRPLLRDAAGDVRAVNRIEVDVVTSGAGGVNEINEPNSFSAAFGDVYRSSVANLDDLYPEFSDRAPGRMILIGTSFRFHDLAAVPYYQRWLDLKKRKGYTVMTASLRTIFNAVGDSSMYGIRHYLQQAYDDHSQPDLDYVVIVGDKQEIPTLSLANPAEGDSSYGDNWFYCLAGHDSIADVLHGRISCESGTDYASYFSKVFSYETHPDTSDMSWFRHATLIAGNFDDGTHTFPKSPVWNMIWAREQLMRDGCITAADTFFYHDGSEDPGEWRQAITNSINRGSCLVLYRGWANSRGWSVPVYDQGDVQNLNNGRKLPGVFGIVCGSGNFAFPNGQCMGEDWLANGNCTPVSPQGGIVFMGASDLHTQTPYNNAILSGIVEAMMRHGVRSTGALEQAGKLEGWREFPSLHFTDGNHWNNFCQGYYYIWHAYNVLGDPEMQLDVCLPSFFTLTKPAQVGTGETLIPITVNSSGAPIQGAVVTLRSPDSTQIVTRRTDAAGNVNLPISFPGTGMAQLTVWKSGYFLKQDSLPVVVESFNPRIDHVNWTAGADGQPNPGKNVSFTLTVQNRGTRASAYALTVTSLDPRVSVTQATATVPSCDINASQTSSALGLSLGSELNDGEHPRLSVQFVDGSDHTVREMEVTVAAPDPVITSLTTNDGGNGILEAGEEAPITMTLHNVGGQEAANLTAEISSFDNAISFPNNQTSWTAIPIGQTVAATVPFTARLAAGVTPGRQILLRVAFLQNSVVVARKSYLIPTGAVTIHDPTGPDAYGYYAYEDIDVAYGPHPATNSWTELDPAFGGANADTHKVRDDTYFAMRLPRTFTYYGHTYDSVWVCSNGWFSFERTTTPEFRNWDIPSPMGAPSLVCPYWDDLMYAVVIGHKDSLHTVWTRMDNNDRFILEWRTLSGAAYNTSTPDTSWCVFEAILEYPNSGDGSIIFQYNQIANLDRDGAGNYGSVGIENSDHERGLCVTFANTYPVSADTLRPGRAIRFTTTSPDNFVGAHDPSASGLPQHFAFHEVYPNPFNPATELSFDLPASGKVTLKVYDVLGKEIATLAEGYRPAGTYRLTFNGKDLPSGLYFARLTAGSNAQVRKLMLIK